VLAGRAAAAADPPAFFALDPPALEAFCAFAGNAMIAEITPQATRLKLTLRPRSLAFIAFPSVVAERAPAKKSLKSQRNSAETLDPRPKSVNVKVAS
jgi:hypothetical protein